MIICFINSSLIQFISQNNFIVLNKSSYLLNLNTAIVSLEILILTFNISVFSKWAIWFWFKLLLWILNLLNLLFDILLLFFWFKLILFEHSGFAIKLLFNKLILDSFLILVSFNLSFKKLDFS